jgi:hypothetical protein
MAILREVICKKPFKKLNTLRQITPILVTIFCCTQNKKYQIQTCRYQYGRRNGLHMPNANLTNYCREMLHVKTKTVVPCDKKPLIYGVKHLSQQ